MAFLRLPYAAVVVIAIVAISASAQDRPDLEGWKAGQAEKQAGADAVVAKQKKMSAVDKAVSLLEGLKGQVLEEGEAEAATYNKFSCFCKDTTTDKAEAISKGEDRKTSLTAEIGGLQSDRDGLDQDIQQCVDDIKGAETDMKVATEARAKTKKEFDANSADMKAAIFALENAIKALKASKTPSLLQFQKITQTVSTAVMLADALGLVPKGNQKVVAALMQQPENGNQVEMEDYKFHSGDILATLEGLRKDFVDEKNSVDAAEVRSAKEHDTFMQEKTDFVKQTNKAMADHKIARDQCISDIEMTSKQLSTVEAVLRDDKEYMTKLSQMCRDKALTWDQRSRVRADELSTLTDAIRIIRGAVSEQTTAATLRFAQQGVSLRLAKYIAHQPDNQDAVEAEAEQLDADEGPASFVQRRMLLAVRRHQAAAPKQDGRQIVAELLKSKGQELKSTLLSALASQITSSADDPFAKIKTLIQELIERLLQEAGNEANQKGWCDKATADAKQKRDYAAEEIKTLNAEMAKLEALRDQLAEDLSVLAAAIKELKASRAEAVEVRANESAENNATVVEAQEGLEALDMCMTLLDRFYKTVKKEKVDLSLAQQGPTEDAPDAGFKIGEAYTGSQGEAGGILGMLEVMKGDFTRTMVETEKAEAQAVKDHLEFMTETGKSLATKEQAESEKTTQKDAAEEKLATADTALDSETQILKQSIQELQDLKPACIDTSMSYAERVSRREDEIEALKKALCILDAYAEYGPEGVKNSC